MGVIGFGFSEETDIRLEHAPWFYFVLGLALLAARSRVNVGQPPQGNARRATAGWLITRHIPLPIAASFVPIPSSGSDGADVKTW